MAIKKKLIAKANRLTADGKVFDSNLLKLHAKESPEKYFYDNKERSLFEERRSKQRK